MVHTSTDPAGTVRQRLVRVMSHTKGCTRAAWSGGSASPRANELDRAGEKSQQYTMAVGIDLQQRERGVAYRSPPPRKTRGRVGSRGGRTYLGAGPTSREDPSEVCVTLEERAGASSSASARASGSSASASSSPPPPTVRVLGEDVRELAREVVPVLEELVLVVLVEDVPVLARVFLVLLHPELRRRWSARSGRVRSVSGNGQERGSVSEDPTGAKTSGNRVPRRTWDARSLPPPYKPFAADIVALARAPRSETRAEECREEKRRTRRDGARGREGKRNAFAFIITQKITRTSFVWSPPATPRAWPSSAYSPRKARSS